MANLAIGALVFGQFLGGGAFSRWLAACGLALWIFLIAVSVVLAGGSE